ncbi:MAG: hypothetical protein ABF310_10510 [Paracoccaceae bacterium]|jgi:hypothetical protein
MTELTTPDGIEAAFTRSDNTFLCARWGRPIAPIVFGVADQTLEIVKGALEAMVGAVGHQMMETDPEFGANMMFFFFTQWDELTAVPDMDRLVPELEPLVARLKEADANQYRLFRFDKEGAISAVFIFVRMDAHLSKMPAEDIALGQIAQSLVLWSDQAFVGTSILGKLPNGTTVLRPDVTAVLRACYDPVLPAAAYDPAHALRIFARLSAVQ